jgi:hypothetical protein
MGLHVSEVVAGINMAGRMISYLVTMEERVLPLDSSCHDSATPVTNGTAHWSSPLRWLKEHQHLRYMWIPHTDDVVVVQVRRCVGSWFRSGHATMPDRCAVFKQGDS